MSQILHEPYFNVDKVMEPPEEYKNDFQNALKRNLHSWAQWRQDVNDSLVDSLFTGRPMDEVGSLDEYLQHHHRPLPTESPKTLLSYSASNDTNTNLKRDHFLSFGIPRIKRASGSAYRASTPNLSMPNLSMDDDDGDDWDWEHGHHHDNRTMSHKTRTSQRSAAVPRQQQQQRQPPPPQRHDTRPPSRRRLPPRESRQPLHIQPSNRLPRMDVNVR